MRAINAIRRELGRLPTTKARRRVIAYVTDAVEEELGQRIIGDAALVDAHAPRTDFEEDPFAVSE